VIENCCSPQYLEMMKGIAERSSTRFGIDFTVKGKRK
jgi:hypothetical protein